MKTIYHYTTLLWVLLLSVGLSSCIDQVTSTDYASQEALEGNAESQKSLFYGIPAAMIATSTSNHFMFGYSSIMHIRDVMTGDMAKDQASNYDQYWSWEQNIYMGRDYNRASYIWNFYYSLLNSINLAVGSVNEATANSEQKGILGAALTYRGLIYTELAQMYEVKANDILPEEHGEILNAKGNNIKGLTVPIVTDTATLEQAQSNPRATREEIFHFVENDLLKAVDLIPNFTWPDKIFPHLDCTYGVLARLYLWHGDYDKAYDYAMKAIENSTQAIITEAKGLDKKTAFNTANDFMWAGQFSKENRAVTSGIINWTSMMSNETYYGYAGGGSVWVMIDASMYARMSDTDWRKRWFKAPEGGALDGQTPFIDDEWGYDEMPTYSSVKFRPAGGEMQDNTIASSSAFPVMRVEEMYFIAAEAAARSQGVDAGVAILNDFMQAYRDPEYNYTASSLDDAVDEIVFQKRVELWGEGLTFYDIKRLNMPVTRGYEGSNFDGTFRFNTTTFPGWMNLIIPQTEEVNNPAAMDYATPDPSGKYVPWYAGGEEQAEAVRHRTLKLK
ncbi:MAG: RagB/SusD family nutrient uptake outer membrane protein [Bacteroidaceae bacterium]|nr:RagB/SusD family nutrient uptake outer membrane protein [Bacteroidaceae bacterium]